MSCIRCILIAFVIVFSGFSVKAQLSPTSDAALYFQGAKAMHLSTSQSPNAPFTIGFPLGLGVAKKVNDTWIVDAQAQYGFWNHNKPFNDIRKRSWLEATLGFQKQYFVTESERFSLNPKFGFGFIQYYEEGNESAFYSDAIVNYFKDVRGGFFSFGIQLDVSLTQRISLFSYSSLRAGLWNNESSYYRSGRGLGSAKKVDWRNLDIDFLFLPIEFGIAYNFGTFKEED
jgi:hypothetical protein